MHAVGQQSPVETLFITVANQRNNGSDQRFLWGLTPACTQQSKELLFSTGFVLRQQQLNAAVLFYLALVGIARRFTETDCEIEWDDIYSFALSRYPLDHCIEIWRQQNILSVLRRTFFRRALIATNCV
jgi:hypothetical protein